MRDDTCGLFWDDTPPPRVVKPPTPPRIPPPRTWEEPGYLPYLEEARRFPVELMTYEELTAAQQAREPLVFDCEVYGNYFLAAFRSIVSGKVAFFEMREGQPLDIPRLRWVLENFLVITFNGNFFDLPVAALALAGLTCAQIKAAANQIIAEQVKPWMVLRSFKVKQLKLDHVDLIEVAPLQASLKIYGGRIHVPRMQELPFRHETILSEDQVTIVRWYCIGSDLTATAFLFMELKPQIELRAEMSARYGVDLRSKSDAQIAEAVLNAEIKRLTYSDPKRPEIPEGSSFKYQVPSYINFESPVLQHALATVAAADFIIGEHGAPELPKEIGDLKIELDGAVYQMGIGGLHSCENKVAFYADENHRLVDRDVASYYPAIILNQGLYPKHLGPDFLAVYRTLVNRRLEAKKAKNKIEADTLKIVVNGSFGKLGSKWSTLYAPDLMVQVTMSGQLSLLMLIERLNLWGTGAKICSANTDGILFRYHKDIQPTVEAIVAQWEKETGFITEETEYRGIFARDVNNYIAVKFEGKADGRFLDEKLGCKTKGTYCERGSAGDSVLSKNPVNLICNDAVLAFFVNGTPIEETIRGCRDIRRFVTVRTVKGGAVKDGEYLGKAIRYYYSAGMGGEIVYASNGNKVPNSDGARPCMELPTEFPFDVDFARYESEALEILRDIAYLPELVET